MKKPFTLICLLIIAFFTGNAFAQDTIVKWTFPSTSADSIVDGGLSINSSRFISCQYGTYGAPSYTGIPSDYTTNGSLGSPDKCAKTTRWNNAVDSMYYMVKFKTTGYSGLKLYSKQQSGGTNPGPRDFKVQYKLSGSTTWIDIPGGTIICANDWTTGVLNGIDLPIACENQTSNVSVRWLITSDLDINGNALLSTGISKLDDIIVTGNVISGIETNNENNLISIYPNPSQGSFSIDNNGGISKINIYNIVGKCIYSNENANTTRLYFNGFTSGIYMVQIISEDNLVNTYKVIVE